MNSSCVRKRAREDDLEDDLELHKRTKSSQWVAKSIQELSAEALEYTALKDMSSTTQGTEAAECIRKTHPTKPAEAYFTHEPLQLDVSSIRLIRLLPLDADREISCTVRHVTLEVPPSYDPLLYAPIAGPYMCLSYVWGPPDQTRWIKVNGKPFQVRMNLWNFLYTASLLRRTEKHSNSVWYTSLWIDAICIDQENNSEKNHQVQQMGRIFASAAEVIAWLGDDDTLATLMRSERPETISPKHLDITRIPGKPMLTRQPEYYEALSNNAYWTRAWVIQEILHARQLFFLAKGVMMHVGGFRQMLLRVPKGRVTELLNLLDYAAENSSDTVVSIHLITNIELFRRKDCINIRDRIYSLLSVSSDGSQLPVDYDCSVVDLIRSVLGINKRGVCFQSVLSLLQAVQLKLNLLDLDACIPLIAIRGSEALGSTSTCHRCGDDISTIRHTVPVTAPSKSRYVCLHCNHFGSPQPAGVHLIRQLGHLCVTWGEVAEEDCFGWHLFWAPLDGGEWQRLQGYKYVLASKKGDLLKLILSLGLLCELESLISRHHDQVSIPFLNYRTRQYPASTLNWEVLDSEKISPL